MRFLTLGAVALLLAGCVVGPNHVDPRPMAPAQTQFYSAQSPNFVPAEPPGNWWSLFRNPQIDVLVQQALAANTDLRIAAANLRRARAALRETRTQRLPSTDISGSASYAKQPGTDATEYYDAGIDVGYQLDLFGRITRAIQASRADAEATQAAYDLARITVAAETTRAYADVCSYGDQLQVAQQTLNVQEQTFALTRRLFEGGRSTALETSRAGALLEQTRAAIPTLEAQRQTALFRLSVLTGKPPAEFPRFVEACVTPPTLAQAIPVGSGATLIARRPDIRAAERRLAAATARIGVATADLYPSVSLGGSLGSSAVGSVGDLFSNKGFRFSLGGLISWTFPNVAAARARIAQARASNDAALADFDGTWLRALEETEGGLTRYAKELERLQALKRARANSNEAARIARLRYRAGRESFQVVLDAERDVAQTDAAVAQSEAQLSDNLIALFLALGGGWQAPKA